MESPTCDAGLRVLSQEGVDRLTSQVQRRLGSRVRHLRLVVQGPGLILRGRAQTYYAKQLAQHAAMQVSGLPIVANEIEVT
jgi:hypothetical protein